MVASGYSCDSWEYGSEVGQALWVDCYVCTGLYIPLDQDPGEGTPENAAFGRAKLCADLPCDWTEEEGILSKVHKGWGLSYSPLSSLFWAAGPFSTQDDLCLLPSSHIKQRLKVCGNNTKRYKIFGISLVAKKPPKNKATTTKHVSKTGRK